MLIENAAQLYFDLDYILFWIPGIPDAGRDDVDDVQKEEKEETQKEGQTSDDPKSPSKFPDI